MNTALKIISLVLAASLATSFAAELSGLMVPAPVDPIHLFAALVAALVLLTAFAEYSTRSVLRVSDSARLAYPVRFQKASHPLAA